ncbi:mucin-2 [Phlebotomus argentipes]|uniref:mucin-2 n=1 Tax=Phlebotomus argentipes TaxID=94469 RepID=UPI0028929854|nr:mucin-2 [Phlebotomus argentipes]
MGIPAGILWILALMLIFSEDSALAQRQTARSSGPTARAFGVNPKQSSSTATADFDCPEEFGYYPHPTDCTQYYVCVFGSALLESCTGGLMYSHELQTCDWPRNVGCDAADAAAPSTSAPRQQQQPQVTRVPQIQQVQPQKIRFTSVPSVIAGHSAPAQIQAIPPPPELKVAPNPVITSRGQPKQVLLQEDIAQLYADAHDTLPPAEEEESDRQQRVYRGQPSTVGQVQRDRDGILQQSSVNAIPSHGKVGSFAFGSQVNQYSDDDLQDVDVGARTKTRHDRKKRDVADDLDTGDSLPEAAALHAIEDVGGRQARQLRPHKASWAFGGFQTNTHKHLTGFQPPPLVDQSVNQYFSSAGQHLRSSLSNPYTVFNTKNSFSPAESPNYSSYERSPSSSREKTRTASGDLVPLLVHPLTIPHQVDTQSKPVKEASREVDGLPDNFSFFHFAKGTGPTGSGSHPKPQHNFNYLPNTTPKSPFVAFSTVGGFYNNKPTPPTTSDKYLKQQYRLQQDGRQVEPAKPHNPVSEVRPGFYSYNFYSNPDEGASATTTQQPAYNSGFYVTQKPKSSKPPGFQPIRNYYGSSEETTKPPSYAVTENPPATYTSPTSMTIGDPAGPGRPHNSLGFNSDTFVRKPSVINPGLSNLDFSQFMSDIRQSHLSPSDPDIGKNHTFISMSTPRPFNFFKTTPKPLASDEEYYYDSSEEEELPKTTKSPSSQYFRPSTRYTDNNFIKSVPPPNFGKHPPKTTPPTSSEEYYYDDDYEVQRPPANKSKFMPMSETMAPRPSPTPTLRPTISPTQVFKPTSYRPPQEHVSDYDIRLLGGTSSIPPIIKFPDDIFQDLTRPRTPNKTMVRPTTPRPRIKIKDPFAGKVTTTPETHPYRPTRPTMPTTDTTTHKIHTVRPSRGRNPTTVGAGNRGTMKWKSVKSTKRPDRLGDLDERLPNRVESSSPASNSYVQPQKVNTQNTRNYYNTTQGQYDQYDPYAYVYDDDVELYRDVDYGQQYNGQNNQKPQVHQSTYRPSIITSSTPATASPAPTHSSTPYAPVQAHRDAYVPQQPQYERPAQVYTTDYEDDDVLLSQLEQEGLTPYNQGTRQGIRGDRNELNSITERPIVISTTHRTATSPKYPSITTTTHKKVTTTATYSPAAPTRYSQFINTQSTTLLSVFVDVVDDVVKSLFISHPYRSSLSDGSNNKTDSRVILTLKARADVIDTHETYPDIEHSPSSEYPSLSPTHPLPSQERVTLLSEVQEPDTVIITISTNTTRDTEDTSTPLARVAPVNETEPESTAQVARKKNIFDYVYSDIQPQSFRPPDEAPEAETHNAIDSTTRPSSTTSTTTSTTTTPQPVVEAKIHPVPLFFRNRENSPLELVIPTTTPSPYNWDAAVRLSPSTTTLERVVETSTLPKRRFFSTPPTVLQRGTFPVDFGLNRTHTPFTTPRNLFFKEVLNKTLDTGATSGRPFVSPYKSLENLLTTDSTLRGTTSSLRPVVRTTPTNAQPIRSHFLITAAPRINITSTESTTTESTTTTSTTTQAPIEETTVTEEEEPPVTDIPEVEEDLTATVISRSRSRGTPKIPTTRGRLKGSYVYTTANTLEIDPTTYAPKLRFIPLTQEPRPETTTAGANKKRVIKMRVPPKRIRNRVATLQDRAFHESSVNRDRQQEVIPLEKLFEDRFEKKNASKFASEDSTVSPTDSSQKIVEITDRPVYFAHYKRLSDKPKKHYLENYEFIRPDDELTQQANREKFRATVEMPEFNVPTESERASFRDNVEPEVEEEEEEEEEPEEEEDLDDDLLYRDQENPLLYEYPVEDTESPNVVETTTQTTTTRRVTTTTTTTSTPKPTTKTTTTPPPPTTEVQTTKTTTTKPPTPQTTTRIPPRASRVNNAIKTTIAASLPRRIVSPAASLKCTDNSPNAKCNEIPSRTHTRNRGSSHYSTSGDQHSTVTSNRGTHPPRARPTLKPSQTIVSKAQEYIDIYRFPPWRPDPVYPQPTPDKTAAKCRKDVCLLPDCFCGGKDIPGDMPVEHVPQIVLLTFDDSVNDLNKQLYVDLFEKGRVNPNGCPITATFYVSHEWTDYSQVQNLYSDGHEMASHTVSHSFGEQFSQKKWTKEVAGQREILSAYGGVKLEDVRGMRAPFLSIGGNKMFKMLYDSNFTYDSSMPVYENRPPSWPYTLDYKIFHDCMIPPCPTKSYPGVWEVPMVMWQDLNGGRCSMGDACSNPPEAEGVVKMLMKNFERHYTTNRAPFGLYYHAAWFTQPHHKEGFIQFLDAINSMKDVWIVTNWQALQWVRDPTPISRLNSFQPFQCNYAGRPKRCNNPKVCNLWHKSGVRYMRTCQPCPDIYPWTGKSGIRSSRVDNDIEE